MAATTPGSLLGPTFFAYSALYGNHINNHFFVNCVGSKTYNATLCDHGLELLRRQRLLKEVHQVDLGGVEKHVAGDEELVRLAETEQLEAAHELLVLLRALAHGER